MSTGNASNVEEDVQNGKSINIKEKIPDIVIALFIEAFLIISNTFVQQFEFLKDISPDGFTLFLMVAIFAIAFAVIIFVNKEVIVNIIYYSSLFLTIISSMYLALSFIGIMRKTLNSPLPVSELQGILKLSVISVYSLFLLFILFYFSRKIKKGYSTNSVFSEINEVKVVIDEKLCSNKLCPTEEAIKKIFSNEFASTGTCIPFQHVEEDNTIKTFLIFNAAYKESKWMFPGGHAYSKGEDFSPKSVAIAKTREEAGLSVEIVNLFGSYKTAESEVEKKDKAKYWLQHHPHYTYLFELTEHVKCYNDERGHRYHIDSVYVGNVIDIPGNARHLTLEIKLPNESITAKQIAGIIEKSIYEFTRTMGHKEGYEYLQYENYVANMLSEAHRDYVSFLRLKEVK